MLSPKQLREFNERGSVPIKRAFAADAAAAMVDRIWASLENRFGVSRTDPTSWKLPLGLKLRDLRGTPIFREVGSATTRAALDDLSGEECWEYPPHWGQFLVSFPNPAATPWTVPHNWHTDFPYRAPPAGPAGALVFNFLSRVPPGHGGTVALEGSPGIVRAFVAKRPQVKTEKMKVTRLALMNSDPWLKDLNSGRNDGTRIARFMEEESKIGEARVRVVEFVGEPGDVEIGHPWLLHSPALNCGPEPRFMLLQRIRFEPNPSHGKKGPGRVETRRATRETS